MKKSSKTVLYFSYYLFIVGIELALNPSLFTKLAFLPETTEPWIRVAGILAIILGYYYHQASSKDLTEFVKLTVVGRAIFFVGSALLVAFGIAPIIYVAFGLVDLLTALWTRQTLKNEGNL